MSKFVGTDYEGELIGPSEAGWTRIAVVTTDRALERVLKQLKPLVEKKTVHLANAQRTPEGKRPVLLLFAGSRDAVRHVMKAVGGLGKVQLVD